jgi:hypothetical protein
MELSRDHAAVEAPQCLSGAMLLSRRRPPKQRRRRSRSNGNTEIDAVGPKKGPDPRALAGVLFAILFFTYLANGMLLPGNDATPNVRLPMQILEHGSVFFTPEQNPSMFTFRLRTREGTRETRFHEWNASPEGGTALPAEKRGQLSVDRPKYYLVPTQDPDKFANTFGLGAGLLALPVLAAVKPFVLSLEQRNDIQWHLGKIVAAAATAGSAVFLFLAAVPHVPWLAASLLALAYGAGTCVWSTSSQALWQHGPCELFLAIGAYFLLRRDRRHADALSGLSLGLAVFCRPAAALVVLAVALSHALTDRRRLLRFVLGGSPIAAILLAYSQYAFGDPFAFGQLASGAEIARAKTGDPNLWQTPLYWGAAGLLFSPGRGLLVYSPVAIFALWGAVRAFLDPVWKDLRPLAVAAAGLFVLSSKWFDWWGGWCFGYRPIVDISILLAFTSLPIVERVRAGRFLKASFALLLCWSVGVQILGAFAYDVAGWNDRTVYQVIQPGTEARIAYEDETSAARHVREYGGRVELVHQNIDLPVSRMRLWSLGDSPILYYLSRFATGSEARKKYTEDFLRTLDTAG